MYFLRIQDSPFFNLDLDTKYPEVYKTQIFSSQQIRESMKQTTTFLLRAFYFMVHKLPVI